MRRAVKVLVALASGVRTSPLPAFFAVQLRDRQYARIQLHLPARAQGRRPRCAHFLPAARFGLLADLGKPTATLSCLADGGMGTTLQAPPFELGLDSALWSSELLATEPGRAQLDKLHRTWVEAGADVVETCTYVASRGSASQEVTS